MTNERAKRILEVEVDTYDYKSGVVSVEEQYDRSGVIAEPTANIFPEAVLYKEIEGLGNVPDSVDYSRFVPSLIKMVQIQQKEIDQLQAENAALAERIAAIEERLGIAVNDERR